MRWVQNLHTWFKISILFLTVFIFGAFIFQIGRTVRQLGTLSWPSVTGEVQGVIAKPWETTYFRRGRALQKKTRYFGRVLYRYTVAGQTYTSDLTDLGPGLKHADIPSALADVSRYQPGMKVTVYYDSSNPKMGIVERGIPAMDFLGLLFFGLFGLGGIFISFFIIHDWWKNKQTEHEQRLKREARRRKNRKRLKAMEREGED